MKLMASDIDGTLLFRDEETGKSFIKQKDIEAIEQFRKDGNVFAVCTGRGPNGTMFGLGGMIEPDYYICASGAVILDKDKEIIFAECLQYNHIKKIMNLFDEVRILLHGDETYAYFKNYDSSMFSTEMRNGLHIIENPEEIMDVDIYGMSILPKDTSRSEEIYNKIVADFSKVIAAYKNNSNIDMSRKGISKGTGVEKLAKWLHISMENVAAIGDANNDIEMLDTAENSFTFNHCSAKVQAHADFLVDDVAEALKIFTEE